MIEFPSTVAEITAPRVAARAAKSSVARGAWRRRALFYVGFLCVWEALARSGFWPQYLFPGPTTVVVTLIDGFRDGHFLGGALVSLRRVAIGYGISLVVGVVLGLLLGTMRRLDETLGSLVLGLQALPSVCWLPLSIVWMGLNERAIVFVVVMGALFSITLGVRAGVRTTPPMYLKAARNHGAHGVSLYWQVVLPAALPSVLGGLQLGWSFAWRSLMAAELLYHTLSLGNLLQTGRDLNDAPLVMAVMLVIIALGIAVDQILFAPAERRVAERWGLAP